VRLTIWGCRGSVSTPGPSTLTYGGNTSCVEVAADDETALVLDAGTGVRALGRELAARGTRRIHLLLTHLHLDHLEGLRFFDPLWDPRVSLDIWGPRSPTLPLRESIVRSFSPPLFPVDFRDVSARVTFHDVPRQAWTIGGVTVRADLVVHPGPTLGFRLEAGRSSLAYLPDHEPALAGPIADRSADWISGAAIAENVDVLVHDAQYFADEYAERVGWGHSSVGDAVAFAETTRARRLLLFHHDPLHADGKLVALGEEARERWRGAGAAPELAAEGMQLDV
jgi:phosphoribosyl 1,2-cyclic phosphodiesterase